MIIKQFDLKKVACNLECHMFTLEMIGMLL